MPFKDYRITSNFGYRTLNGVRQWHTGIDLVKYHKAPIHAFTSGVVLYAGFGKSGTGLGGYGNVVLIEDKNGRGQLYAHLNEVLVKKGDKIKKGDVIGTQGNTGQSYGSHLHFEVRKKAEGHVPYGWTANRVTNCLDPTTYLKSFKEDERVFKDVGKNHSAFEATKRLKEKGVFQGYPDGTFRPDEPITRGEMAIVIDRLLNSK